MRIAILNLTGGGMSGGYRKYLRNVIPRMASNPEVERLLCASPETLNVQAWLDPPANVEFVNCKPYQFWRPSGDAALKWHLKRFSPDVIFIPVARLFRFNKVPVVNMVHNMEPFVKNVAGNPITERLRQCIQLMDGARAIKNADRVIALSKFVSDILTKRCGIPNKQFSLVYYGIDINKDEKTTRPRAIPKGWHSPFIFTAGSIRPARGLEDLLLAMHHLASRGQSVGRVVIAGEAAAAMSGYQKKLQDWVKMHNLASQVCWTGGLEDREIAWCYQNCWAFVMTSRVESFGMTGGEAMSHGCICISADNPCLPEIFGDAAIFYPPSNGKALAEVIQSLLGWDNNRRKDISEKTRKRALDFSWDVCAERTVAALAEAIDSSKAGEI